MGNESHVRESARKDIWPVSRNRMTVLDYLVYECGLTLIEGGFLVDNNTTKKIVEYSNGVITIFYSASSKKQIEGACQVRGALEKAGVVYLESPKREEFINSIRANAEDAKKRIGSEAEGLIALLEQK
ncbi:MAG: hypothetical protein WC548_02880 [Candidatus Pacearchaeota archaeon]